MPDSIVPPSSRRAFLRLAAVAPLAAAGCAAVRAGPATAPAAGPSTPTTTDPLEALRAVPLTPAVEPAMVFRVLGGRARCG